MGCDVHQFIWGVVLILRVLPKIIQYSPPCDDYSPMQNMNHMNERMNGQMDKPHDKSGINLEPIWSKVRIKEELSVKTKKNIN